MVSLAQALGRAVARHSGLTYFHLPTGLGPETAAEIVRSANDTRPEVGPFSILIDAVDAAGHLAEPNVPVVKPKDSVKYRQGDRAAVIYGRQPDLASFLQTFQEIGGPSYPDNSSTELRLSSIAEHLAQGLAADLNATADPTVVSGTLSGCLGALRDLYELDERGVGVWNVRWFRHVESGLASLAGKLRELAATGTAETLGEAVEQWAPACFGLPRGSAASLQNSAREARLLVDAYNESWADADTAKRSLTQISLRSGNRALASLDTSALDDAIAQEGDIKLGLASWVAADEERLGAFHEISHRDFVDPSGYGGESIIELEDAARISLSLNDSPSSPVLVPLTLDMVNGGRRPRSERITLSVPWNGPLNAAPAHTLCSLRVATATAASWTTEDVTVDGGQLRVSGYFERGRGSGLGSPFRATALALEVNPRDELSVYVGDVASRLVYFFTPEHALLVLAPIKSKGRLGRPTVLDSTQEGGSTEELASTENGYQAIFWHPDTSISVTLDGQELETHPAIPEIRLARYVPQDESVFAAGETTFRTFPVAQSTGQQSALIASALRERVSSKRPESSTERSIRGQLEDWYARRVMGSDKGLLQALGHIVMPSNHEASVAEAEPVWGGSVYAGQKTREGLQPALIQFPFDDQFVRGPEAEAFRASFSALALDQFFAREDAATGSYAEWPSRTSFRSLWDDEKLKAYLSAYADLVDAARRQQNELMIFWAAYPMSVSLWDLGHASKCRAVMLSPLHPVRLAWLAGCEAALSEAERARDLLGAVEGWNFPVVGPGTRRHRRMVAVPVDAGEQQIFLGWSMLVAAGTEDPAPVISPSRIGSTAAPGTAASGLNQTSVDSALRSYRSMHPHVSTLTVDLMANEPQNRVTEIDEAVLRIAREWSASGETGLAGGIRVLDSTMRSGEPPRDSVSQLVRNNEDLLVTWSRYTPGPFGSAACDIRFLEGSGVNVQVTSRGRALGAIGRYPLRRFEAHGTPVAFESASNPAPLGGGNESPLVPALRALEGDVPAVVSSMDGNMLNDGNANWTVMGETHLNPAAMSTLVQQYSSHDAMLWEWRPPLFDRTKGLPLVERRPHISIAKIPATFGEELETLLKRATGSEDVNKTKSKVLRTLGQRGVGLSSLLSLGGTHVAGALGFYLAFELFDCAEQEDLERFLIPIDAADYFLRILANDPEHGRHQQRADLLLIELAEGRVTLCPVEIKSYGLKTSSEGQHRLPDFEGSALDEPRSQLAASTRIVRKIVLESESLQEGADRALWFNALTTLVETAIKLKPAHGDGSEKLARWLADMANGRVSISCGSPILTYFEHQARTSVGETFRTGVLDPAGLDALALVTDTGAAFRAASGEEQDLIRQWSQLVDNATGNGAAQPVGHGSGDHMGSVAEVVPEGPFSEVGTAVRSYDMEPSGDVRAEEAGGPSKENPKDDEVRNAPSTGDEAGGLPGIAGSGVRVHIGEVLDSVGHASVDYWAGNTALNQLNIGIAGDLGTGKTEFIKALLAQIREQARDVQPSEETSILIFDYKGDFQAPEFLERVGGTVLSPNRIPLNVFMPVTEDYSRKPYQQAGAFVDTLAKIYSGVGPVQSSALKNVIRDLFEEKNGLPPTLAEVHELYTQRQDRADSVSSILETFVYNEIFDSNRANLRSFRELLDGRVLVVALNHLGSDQEAKNALVALFLNLYYDYMIRSPKPPFQGKNPQLRYVKSFLVVDEAVNIMRYDFSVLMDLMLQGRQFGFGVVLASQFLTHFDAGRADYKEPLRTWVIHRVPNVSARTLAGLGMAHVPDSVVNRIAVLEQHQALYKSYGCDMGRLVRVVPYYQLTSR
ncbi:ATP-binding protein [Sinomonas atrocyanea]|uniref:ATP-binding protein n=1 Tax=Sinomonas atrocyanea TaxID=37927 RepID=UPI003D9718D0